MKKISDKEALKDYKKSVIDKIIAKGKDPEKLMIATLSLPGEEMSAAELFGKLKEGIEKKKAMKPFVKEQLRKWKEWMKYKRKKEKTK